MSNIRVLKLRSLVTIYFSIILIMSICIDSLAFGHSFDHASGIYIDCAAMPVVTGTIVLLEPAEDMYGPYMKPVDHIYGTLKYNQNGDPIWISFFDEGDARDLQTDQATDVILDDYGNVVVAGTIDNEKTDEDYAVVKYNAFGEQLWSESYNAHEKGTFDSVRDVVDIVTLDDSGNIYISGTFCVTEQEHIRYCSVGTIKYDSNGIRKWVSSNNDVFFDHGGNVEEIKVDFDGNVYIWAVLDVYDIIIKYDSEGNEIWTLDRESGDYEFFIRSVVFSELGEVYATGFMVKGFTTIKYNSNASKIWEAKGCEGSGSLGRKIIQGVDGDSYVIGTCDYEYFIMKYDSGGNEIFKNIFSAVYDDVEVDSNGNLYMAGATENEDGSARTIETSMYDSNGELVWRHVIPSYSDAEIGYDVTDLSGIALDENNSALYIAGTNSVYLANSDHEERSIITIKYGLDGSEQWTVLLDHDGDYEDKVFIEYNHPCYHEDEDESDDDNDDDSDTCGCGCL